MAIRARPGASAPELRRACAAALHDVADRIEQAGVVAGDDAPREHRAAAVVHCHLARRRCRGRHWHRVSVPVDNRMPQGQAASWSADDKVDIACNEASTAPQGKVTIPAWPCEQCAVCRQGSRTLLLRLRSAVRRGVGRRVTCARCERRRRRRHRRRRRSPARRKLLAQGGCDRARQLLVLILLPAPLLRGPPGAACVHNAARRRVLSRRRRQCAQRAPTRGVRGGAVQPALCR